MAKIFMAIATHMTTGPVAGPTELWPNTTASGAW
jgi:hypothetical protein